jgi:pimeloyl-ACP methyl ester carboxylesterase
MGGPVAIAFLQLFPEKSKALVLADSYIPRVGNWASDRAKQIAQREQLLQLFRRATYKEEAPKILETMFSDKTTAGQRREILTKMLATPQYVMVSAMEDLFEFELPTPPPTYSLPVLAIMAAKPDSKENEARLRTLFSDITYTEWPGAGHFLMMESPNRFNRALTSFLSKLGIEQRQ